MQTKKKNQFDNKTCVETGEVSESAEHFYKGIVEYTANHLVGKDGQPASVTVEDFCLESNWPEDPNERNHLLVEYSCSPEDNSVKTELITCAGRYGAGARCGDGRCIVDSTPPSEPIEPEDGEEKPRPWDSIIGFFR